ncbi:MAG: hypothetical protein H6696_05015 [Deferribacteres bacterium]|nr:hypothetical protein [candidate division KSB1 bacterium]MCB9501277.1 hypothetical protein [Deferribacteres bacterium]
MGKSHKKSRFFDEDKSSQKKINKTLQNKRNRKEKFPKVQDNDNDSSRTNENSDDWFFDDENDNENE